MSAVLDGVSPRARRTDPVTSVDAGRSVNLPESQAQVLEFLGLSPAREWILAEFELAVRGWALDSHRPVFSLQRYRSAVAELRDKGLIVNTGQVRHLSHGRGHQVWRLA